MNHTVLLVVDVQTALIDAHPFREQELIASIQTLLDAAREHGTEVVYVRHDGGSGDELEFGTDGWQIDRAIAPLPDERVFDKRYNSAFKDTGLHEYLTSRNICEIFLVGMQTEYCIDATCKVAFELGYSVVIPSGVTTTYDNVYLSGEMLVQYYEETIWNNRFARVVPLEDAVRRLQSYL